MEMESEEVNRRRWSPSSSSSLEEEEEESSLSRGVMKMKHACKLCNKSFPCGRSLGGHMRSHLINNMTATTTHQTNKDDREKVNTANKDHQMKPNSSISSDCNQANLQKSRGSNNIEMKKWCCRECGKEFQSTKALSGHMKSHAVQREKKAIIASSLLKNHNSSNNHENDSSSSRACSGIVNNSGDFLIKQQQQKVLDTQSISDNNEATTTMTFLASPDSKHHDRPRRSSRRPRYIGSAPATATANDSVSVSSPNNNISATNNDQQDQEAEVAMSLVLLSNDLGSWGNHQISQNSSFLQFEGASASSSSIMKKQSSLNGKLKTNENFSATDEEMRMSLISCSKSLLLDHTVFDYDGYNYNGAPTATSCNKRKPKMEPFLQYSEDGSRSFECTTCNKSFRSYQALGGHRASHKKTKGCSSSSSSVAVIGMCEDTTAVTYDDDSKSKIINPQQQKQHECPICFKVFPSGQALGGHKRSHVIGQEVRNATTTVTIDNCNGSSNSGNGLVRSGQKNDFLDLNFPPAASTEEDQASNASIVVGFKPPCWVETSHNNHEQPLVGFI